MAEGIYLLMGRVSSSHLCLYVTMASRRAVKTISIYALLTNREDLIRHDRI
jgi:hypothetical protein